MNPSLCILTVYLINLEITCNLAKIGLFNRKYFVSHRNHKTQLIFDRFVKKYSNKTGRVLGHSVESPY